MTQITADSQCCFESGKVYTHAQGLSVAFRQWGASSHCRFIHGYSLQVEVTFGCSHLDENNWAFDFGNLKWLREYLEENFDHMLLVAKDDPYIDILINLSWECTHKGKKLAPCADVRVVDAVGIEAFSKEIFDYINNCHFIPYNGRVWVESVTVREHEANFATYKRKPLGHP